MIPQISSLIKALQTSSLLNVFSQRLIQKFCKYNRWLFWNCHSRFFKQWTGTTLYVMYVENKNRGYITFEECNGSIFNKSLTHYVNDWSLIIQTPENILLWHGVWHPKLDGNYCNIKRRVSSNFLHWLYPQCLYQYVLQIPVDQINH